LSKSLNIEIVWTRKSAALILTVLD